jgi:hypothetical protein
MKYIETFEIPGAGRYGITRDAAGYQAWSGGCAVGGCRTLVEVRCYIHNHAKETLNRSILNTNRLLTKLNESNNALKADVFYLGKFLVEND